MEKSDKTMNVYVKNFKMFN